MVSTTPWPPLTLPFALFDDIFFKSLGRGIFASFTNKESSLFDFVSNALP
jgi:hypothetical protein